VTSNRVVTAASGATSRGTIRLSTPITSLSGLPLCKLSSFFTASRGFDRLTAAVLTGF
jgi:hypothetical protein